MLPPLPRCSGRAYSSLRNHPSVSAFPDSTIGSACTSSFSRFAQRLLALRPAHSRGHQIRDRYPGASDISSPPCLPRLLPAGAIAGWALHPLEKRRLVTAHVESRPSAEGQPASPGMYRERRTLSIDAWSSTSLRTGDVLTVTLLDRLARSTRDLLKPEMPLNQKDRPSSSAPRVGVGLIAPGARGPLQSLRSAEDD